MSGAEVAKIAAGLTKAQQEMVRTGRGDHETAMSPEVYALWVGITKHAPKDFEITLNPLGLAVRAYLEEQQT